MITESSIVIDAPAGLVWDVFTDVGRWPEWTASISSLTPLDGPALAPGKRFAIKQPRIPKVVWEVTAIEPGRSWTWRQRSFLATSLAIHELSPKGDDRTLVRQRIEQRGAIGVVVGALMRGLTKRYLAMEGEGLKARTEERQRRDAPAA